MSQKTVAVTLRMPRLLRDRLVLLASKRGISLNQLIVEHVDRRTAPIEITGSENHK